MGILLPCNFIGPLVPPRFAVRVGPGSLVSTCKIGRQCDDRSVHCMSIHLGGSSQAFTGISDRCVVMLKIVRMSWVWQDLLFIHTARHKICVLK